jgi:hypothetical protein
MVVAGAMSGAEGSAHGRLFVWCCGPLAGIFIVFDYSAPAPNPAGARAKAVRRVIIRQVTSRRPSQESCG